MRAPPTQKETDKTDRKQRTTDHRVSEATHTLYRPFAMSSHATPYAWIICMTEVCTSLHTESRLDAPGTALPPVGRGHQFATIVIPLTKALPGQTERTHQPSSTCYVSETLLVLFWRWKTLAWRCSQQCVEHPARCRKRKGNVHKLHWVPRTQRSIRGKRGEWGLQRRPWGDPFPIRMSCKLCHVEGQRGEWIGAGLQHLTSMQVSGLVRWLSGFKVWLLNNVFSSTEN